MASMIVERAAVVLSNVPINTTGAAATGLWISMRNYRRCLAMIFKGAWAAGTPAVTLNQATDNAGAGSKALAFTVQYKGTGGAQTSGNDVMSKNTVTSNTFNLSATANEYHCIEVHAQDLDVANNFDHFQVSVASPGANADLICIAYILEDAAFEGLPSTRPSVLG